MKYQSTIYQLITGELDVDSKGENDGSVKKRNAHYVEVVRYTYDIIGNLFKNKMSDQLLQMCLDNGTLAKLFERLGQLTGENSRTKVVLPVGGEISTSD